MADDSTRDRYDPHAIEPVWAKRWVDEGLFTAEDPRTSDKPKFYALDMFSYPSGDLHMGHLEAYTGCDIVARYRWMKGYNVLHPIGWDAFGLPAENAAIKNGTNPLPWTYKNVEQQADSYKRLGYSFDWTRRFNSCDVDYYRWTQWLFLKFMAQGIVYRKTAPVNWCPNDKTVLANEQVVGGRCDRCDAEVTKREVPAWFFRETAYADRLLDDMDQLTGWSDRVLTMQRNWIGRSQGADVVFTVAETGEKITVYTTRPDTLWGVTFFVLAAEHPMGSHLISSALRTDYDSFIHRVRNKTEIERTALGRSREGLFTGAHAINPVNGERIPIFLSDYVLMEYGTGALMAVPAHDDRDLGFARQFGLTVQPVIAPADGSMLDGSMMTEPYLGDGTMTNSGDFDGTPTAEAADRVIDWLEAEGLGKRTIRYRLRDWNVSRQRFWGCPIPMIRCPKDGDVPVPYEDLPVVLPELEDYTPTGTGESPLAKAEDWVNVSCPKCGGPAKREVETLDTFIDSSWYFFRYTGATDDAPFDPEEMAAWMPVDQYCGGIEHATGHLLYSRFFTKVLHDIGLIDFTEPYPNLLNQGQVIMDGAAMSKSRGNLVAPAQIVDEFGADTARVTMMFAGPYEADVDWADVSPHGVFKWLSRVWRLAMENADAVRAGVAATGDSALRRATHIAIDGVTTDVERFRFNTAIAKMMTLSNEVQGAPDAPPAERAEAVDALVRMLQPFAPFMTAELWVRFGYEGSAAKGAWPAFDPALTVVDTATMVVQVNGKLRDRIDVSASITEDEMLALAMASANVQQHLEGKTVRKTHIIPPKLVSIVAN